MKNSPTFAQHTAIGCFVEGERERTDRERMGYPLLGLAPGLNGVLVKALPLPFQEMECTTHVRFEQLAPENSVEQAMQRERFLVTVGANKVIACE